MHVGRTVARARKAVTDTDESALGRAVQFGEAFNLLNRESGDGGGPLRRARYEVCFEFVRHIGVSAHISAVRIAVAKHDVHHRAGKGAIGTGFQHDVHVRDFGSPGAIGIDDDQLRFALAPRLGDVGHDIDLSGCRIAAPHDDEIGFAHLARIGAHFCADSGHPAGVNQRGADGRVLARITHDVAQTIDTVALHEPHGAGVKERPHRCAPQRLRRARELLGDFVERGLPRQRCEFAALGAFALERLGKPFGMMDALGVARNFLADHARRVGVGGGAADAADMVAVEFLDFERARAGAVVRAGAMYIGA